MCKYYKYIPYLLIFFLTYTHNIFAENINIQKNISNNIAQIPLSESLIKKDHLELNLENCSAANNIILDFKNITAKLTSLKINCISNSNIIFQNDEKITITDLFLKNIFFHLAPNASIKNFYLNSSQAVTTALPKISESINIDIKPTKEMQNASSMINAVNIIPGSGEYIYDTKIIYKKYDKILEPINMNNSANIADSEFNLQQLKLTCPNLKWTSPVVSWFVYNNNDSKNTNLNIKNLSIKPGVIEIDTAIDEPWKVAKYNRQNAYLISKDSNARVNFGGTINDQSLIRYIDLLKKNHLKIMFYPMLMVDLPNKPWRGSLIAESTEDIIDFFNKKNFGYNQFILHYAHLLKGKVNAFVIGSEMQKLTNFVDSKYPYPSPNRFPAVLELTKLAKQVKEIMGDDVIVTYAANWSEYHHSNDGYYHLDSLWSSKYIDVVGIDAYLPLTQSTMTDISTNEIKKGWESGELWDYYYNKNSKTPLSAQDGLKRLEHWWSNYHIKDNIKSSWLPKMKKIWFTEFGFASMSSSTNEPHVFYDPNSKEAGIPKYSSGNEDFQLQAKAINATLEYWQNKSDIVQNMFLWAWDARPYPAFPHNQNLWIDGNLWSRGHWINAKISPPLEINITSSFTTKNFHTNALLFFINKNEYCKISNGNKDLFNKCMVIVN
jgi:hypothetical protein